MKRLTKRRIFLLALPFILGCNYLLPQGDIQPGRNSTPLEESAPPTQGGELPAIQESSAPQADSAFTLIRIHPQDGALHDQLAIHAQNAAELGQTPFIEFDATWCPPCAAINASLQAEDPLTLNAFAGVYLIRADVDEWGWGDNDVFSFNAIPIYYRLGEDGSPTGAVVDGGAWGKDIPENFAPVLDRFFHAP